MTRHATRVADDDATDAAFPDIVAPPRVRPLTSQVVVSDRSDGLGERLRGLLSAVGFARLLGVDFQFSWSANLSGSPHHSIASPEEMFEPSFVARHLVERIDRSAFHDVRKRYRTTDQLQAAGRDKAGWLVHQDVNRYLPPDADAPRGAFRSIFLNMPWSAPVRAAVEDAMAVEVSRQAAAIHLRAGDIVYGRYRFSDAYTRKVISLPVGMKLITELAARNDQVVVFNQDRDVDGLLRDLAPNVVMASSLSEKYESAVERAMFEIALMSRCRSIAAGASGFARIAEEIAEIRLTEPERLYKPDQQIGILTRALLKRKAKGLPRLQRAFSAYVLFDVAAAARQHETALEAIRLAIASDGQNPFYRLRLATYLMARGDAEGSEAALAGLLETFDLSAPTEGQGWTAMRVLLDRSPKGPYRLRRDHAALQKAAEAGESPMAARVHALIEAAKAAR